MYVNQIAVFLENKNGRLDDFAKVLADANIDLVSMSIADTKDYGILRAITRDNEKAARELTNAGFVVMTSDLIGVEVPDEAGGLSRVLSVLGKADIDIAYLYSYARTEVDKAIIVMKVGDCQKAVAAMKENNIPLISTQDLFK